LRVGQLRGHKVGTRSAALAACSVCLAVVGLGCAEDEYCEPSYKGVCIPGGAKYDLNCVDLDEADFRVKGGEPIRTTDGDRDGVGCEAY
jgi:hypothetical protein